MVGLKSIIVDKSMVYVAIQEYLDKSISPNVKVASVAIISEAYGSQQNAIIPNQFQIITVTGASDGNSS